MEMNKTLLRTPTGSQWASWCGDFLKENERPTSGEIMLVNLYE